MKHKNILEAVNATIASRKQKDWYVRRCPLCAFYTELTGRLRASGRCSPCIASWEHKGAGCVTAMHEVYRSGICDNRKTIEALQDLRQIIIENGIEA